MRNRVVPALALTRKPRPSSECIYETTARGLTVLNSPHLNKGSAFSADERKALGLTGLLPPEISTLDNQVEHAYLQYSQLPDAVSKNIYLTALHDRNEVLFFRLFSMHLREMIPIVNDLTVGRAIQRCLHECRRPRGVYLSIDHVDAMDDAFANFGVESEDIDLILATDAEHILGIGDWGIGGIEVAIGKLAICTAAGGIDPTRVIPVMLDVGTNRESLLADPTYIGNRHQRIRGKRYDEFLERYVALVTNRFPHALLQWEDFEPSIGRHILNLYRDRICTFNDDMQGTGTIALAAAISALRVCGTPFRNQRVVIFGAGTAGIGVADQFRDAMIREGLTADEAVSQFWCVDRQGLLTEETLPALHDHQATYARPTADHQNWKRDTGTSLIGLSEVVRRVRPTILIGTSSAGGSFTEKIVRQMAAHTDRPIIFVLSTPHTGAEATPADLIAWTDGRALIATGSEFLPVTYKGVTHVIAHVNNAMLYPGLSLGAIVARAKNVSDGMFSAAASAVSSMVSVAQPGASLLPQVDDLRSVSATVAMAVGEAAVNEGLARTKVVDLVQEVQDAMWQPEYRSIVAV